MKHKEAVEVLIKGYQKFPKYSGVIIKGLGYTEDKRTKAIYLKALKNTRSTSIQKKCLVSLAFLKDNSVVSEVKPILNTNNSELKIYTLLVLARYNNREAVDKLLDYLIAGSRREQDIVGQQILHRLRKSDQKYIAERTLNLPEKKAFYIISALRNVHHLPRGLGNILHKLLDQSKKVPLRSEIYKLIAEYVNTKKEVLPQSVLYEAREKTDNVREKNILDNIISKMKKVEEKPDYVNQEGVR